MRKILSYYEIKNEIRPKKIIQKNKFSNIIMGHPPILISIGKKKAQNSEEKSEKFKLLNFLYDIKTSIKL